MRKKLAVLLAAVMCFSAVPQTSCMTEVKATEPGISVLCAHSLTANVMKNRRKVEFSHTLLSDKTCYVTAYQAEYMTYCTQCGQVLHTRTVLEDVVHSIAHPGI